jgi:hypothetical protein
VWEGRVEDDAGEAVDGLVHPGGGRGRRRCR